MVLSLSHTHTRQASRYYAPNEMLAPNSTDDSVHSKGLPYGFFPHQWGSGGPKPPALVSASNAGLYKLYFDSRLTADQANRLVRLMQVSVHPPRPPPS